MKYLITLLCATLTLAQSSEPTNTYLALTATLLEHRIIGDDHLLRMIDGQLNPISEVETKTDSQKLMAHTAYTNVLKENIDATQIAPWAKERLSHEAKERDEKNQKREKSLELRKYSENKPLMVHNHYNCAIKSDRTVRCWGSINFVPEDLGKVLSISGSEDYVCAIKENRTVQCWGSVPYQFDNVLAQLKDVKNLVTYRRIACAVKNDHSAICWGDTNLRGIPSILSQIRSLKLYESHLCAIKMDASAECWDMYHKVCELPHLGPIRDLEISDNVVCAIQHNAETVCWGQIQHPLGGGDCRPHQVPPELRNATQLIPGKAPSLMCAIHGNQESICWNSFGTPYRNRFGRVLDFATNNYARCAIKLDGSISCRESADIKTPSNFQPSEILGLGERHGCALALDRTVQCWGYNCGSKCNVPADLGLVIPPMAGAN